MQSNRTELILIAVVMLFLLVIGFGATALFIRQWRRENRAKKSQSEPNHNRRI